MDAIHVCGGKAPIDPELSYKLAKQESSNNAGARSFYKSEKPQHQRYWAQHKTLKVGFFFNEQLRIDHFKKSIEPWLEHINLNIEFVEEVETADIRVSIDPADAGHWSCIGTDAKCIDRHLPTMHFDITRPYTAKVWSGFILHEFGHALGLDHEHQHPDRTIDWNTPAVYRECQKNEGWTQETTYFNIFDLNPRDHAATFPYDPKSIMHYGFDKAFLWRSPSIYSNFVLSKKDIDLIKSIYPKS